MAENVARQLKSYYACMRIPHFFKAHSRLGLMHPPINSTILNVGVEDGPDAVLTKKFLSTFSQSSVDSYTFPPPEIVNKNTYQEILAFHHKSFANFILQKLTPNETQVVIGGDHAVAMSSLIAVLRRIPTPHIGYIQFDSHGDIHTFTTSPSGNFHGMWLRPFLDRLDVAILDRLVPQKLKPDQVLYIGNLILEPEEVLFMKHHAIKNMTGQYLQANPSDALLQLSTFLNRFQHIHVSFDIDVFNKTVVAATGTPNPDGFFPNDILPLIRRITKVNDLSIDLVEVNPKKEHIESTLRLARLVLTTFLN